MATILVIEDTVHLSMDSGKAVHFSPSGRSVYSGIAGENLRVTKSSGEGVCVTNPSALSGEIRKVWEESQRYRGL